MPTMACRCPLYMMFSRFTGSVQPSRSVVRPGSTRGPDRLVSRQYAHTSRRSIL